MNFSEKYGNSVEEAVELALKDLKATADDVTWEVLEEPSKGFLGLGSKLAKVRVTLKGEKTESKADDGASHGAAPESDSPGRASAKSNKGGAGNGKSGAYWRNERKATEEQPRVSEVSIAAQRPDDLKPVTEHVALDFLKRTTKEMGLELDFTAQENDENIYIDIEGKDVGSIIGKRGQTLDALQYLTSLVVNKDRKGYMRVVLDAENYRIKREKTLKRLADRLAGKAVRTHRPVKLEPMNPYERMVIHASLQDYRRVTTRSEGEDPYRRVVIEPK